MKPIAPSLRIDRRVLLSTLALLPALSASLLPVSAPAQTATSAGLLPSWNDGAAKQAIFDFVRSTIDRSNPSYVFPEDRIATLWVEHPGTRSGGGGEETGTQERRAVQDRTLRQPRGHGQALDARPRENPGCDANRHVGGGIQR
jgi:hypothetical protein